MHKLKEETTGTWDERVGDRTLACFLFTWIASCKIKKKTTWKRGVEDRGVVVERQRRVLTSTLLSTCAAKYGSPLRDFISIIRSWLPYLGGGEEEERECWNYGSWNEGKAPLIIWDKGRGGREVKLEKRGRGVVQKMQKKFAFLRRGTGCSFYKKIFRFSHFHSNYHRTVDLHRPH